MPHSKNRSGQRRPQYGPLSPASALVGRHLLSRTSVELAAPQPRAAADHLTRGSPSRTPFWPKPCSGYLPRGRCGIACASMPTYARCVAEPRPAPCPARTPFRAPSPRSPPKNGPNAGTPPSFRPPKPRAWSATSPAMPPPSPGAAGSPSSVMNSWPRGGASCPRLRPGRENQHQRLSPVLAWLQTASRRRRRPDPGQRAVNRRASQRSQVAIPLMAMTTRAA